MRFFTGKPENRPESASSDSLNQCAPYAASKELVKAVNLAVFLNRPLLLEGEAGCGKTCLAGAIAYELGYPLYRWNIRSKTRYQEGLYEYDALLRLHDVNLSQKLADLEVLEGQRLIDPRNVDNYLDLKALGKAFDRDKSPAVVLIDEIDKADLDFPNDLLTVLEDPYQFTIRETGKTIKAKHPPIVVITSNKEKGNLPAPFLRRCVYHFIEFPSKPEQLREIAQLHFQQGGKPSAPQAPTDELVEAAIDRFLAVRQQGGILKLPGTSEFLDWLGALANFDESAPYSAERLRSKTGQMPYRELLFKLRSDWRNAEVAALSS